jgi:hypothetical protein
MSSESVCLAARCWVEVGSFRTRLLVMFMIFTASVRNILDSPSYNLTMYSLLFPLHGVIRRIRIIVSLIVKHHKDIGVSVKLHAPASFPAGKRPQYRLCKGLGDYKDRP